MILLSPAAIAHGETLTKGFEGCRLAPYLDSRGLPSIAWGNRTLGNGAAVTMQTPLLTQSQADVLFDVVLRKRVLPTLQELLKHTLTDNQGAALISLVWNIGNTAFAHSHVLACINQDLMTQAGEHFLDWHMPGLLRRRIAEHAVWSTPQSPAMASVPEKAAA